MESLKMFGLFALGLIIGVCIAKYDGENRRLRYKMTYLYGPNRETEEIEVVGIERDMNKRMHIIIRNSKGFKKIPSETNATFEKIN